jgi:hypothetical protein
MAARRRAYRLAGPPPSEVDLVSPPLLPYPRARVAQVARPAQGAACVATRRPAPACPAFRRHAGKRRA